MIRSQTLQISLLNLRNLPQRLGSSLVAVIGIAGVVAIVVAVLSIGAGFRKTMEATGSADRAVVLRAGSNSEMVSYVGGDSARLIRNAPGVAATSAGPEASGELFVIIDLPKRTTGSSANVPLRGVEPAAFVVRPEVRIVEGRNFRFGTNELIVGRAARREFGGTEIGSNLRFGGNPWTVVGVFEAGGGLTETELWCDARVLQPAYRRGNGFQAIYARLQSPQAFTVFKSALASDPRLTNFEVERESEYYSSQSEALTAIIQVLGAVIALLMGAGAAFGALNTMYTAVSSRSREIATLRALGFERFPIVLSVLIEALFLGLLGGLLGAFFAYWLFDGMATSTLNFQSFSQVAFSFAVTPALLVTAVFYAVGLGLVGGFLPAIRAANLPIATALREL